MKERERKLYIRRPYDSDRKVDVYRNLHNGLWSVRQKGLVIMHTDLIHLKEVEFIVNESGRQRVLKEKRKNVHAFVRGYICNSKDCRAGTAHLDDDELNFATVYYNPYKFDSFVDLSSGLPIKKSDFVAMDILEGELAVLAIWKNAEIKENHYAKNYR